ncbi:hypothetical protein [Salinibaculum rarum]|jgi:hypothetical protein|uniref:hypothetical protein n=1 Tax=Salinibaculum rarum TaxID=3058903 RepID=UPI00265F7525|nr:hypothetical protein [Salinibaculum sp. KK48]
MAEFTFFKLQVDDVSFATEAPFIGSDDSDAEAEDDEESGSVLAILLGLVFLIVVAVAAKKLLGGRSSESPAVDIDTE